MREVPAIRARSRQSGLAGLALVGLVLGFAPLSRAATLTIVSSGTLPSGTVGTTYSEVLAATGGTGLVYTWTLGGSLPTGLSLSSGGAISGTPTTATAGPAQFGVTVRDATGNTAFSTFSIQINPKPLSITTTSLTAGIAGTEYPHRILAASGGVSPYTFALTGGSLPSGMILSNGTISGTPAAAGAYQITIGVTDSAGNKASAKLSMTIQPASTNLLLSSGSISFSLSQGAGAFPSAQTVQIQSSVVSQQLAYTATTPVIVPWLSVSGGSTTPGTLSFSLTSEALSLAPGTYSATVNVQCTTTGCPLTPLTIPVTLTVSLAPATIKVLNDVIALTTDPSAPNAPLTAQLQIRNGGGQPLTVTSVNCLTTWCTQGAFPASIAGGVISTVPITVTPGSLVAGIHSTKVTVSSSAGTISTPVTLLVLQKPSMGLPVAGAQFTAPFGGVPAGASGSFTLTATGGSYSWSASASATPSWLVVNTQTGTASPTQPATIQYSLNPGVVSGLASKTYYGAVKVTSSGTTNSPEEFRVILVVSQPTDPVRPQLSPAGLILTTTTGIKASGSVSVMAPSTAPVAWQAAAQTASGGSWLTVSPAAGNSSTAVPASTTVTANPAGLGPGVYSGAVSYAFAGAAVRSVNVTLVVTATATGSAPESEVQRGSAGRSGATEPPVVCSSSTVAIAQTGLVSNFSAAASWPVPLAVTLVDNCGNAVSNGQVVATFTNGDPPLSLPLANAGSGLYASTWTPRHTTAQVTINTTANVTGYAAATAALVGEVLPNTEPSLNAYAVLNVFNPDTGDPLAPGTAAAMYGSYLSAGTVQPATVPLPSTAGGTQVFIGGIAAPLYYVSPGQINVQIPFELDPTLQYQVVVSNNGALTTPQPLVLTAANPGIATYGDSTILAEHAADGSLLTTASPAKPGEYMAAFVAGMGATTANVLSGAGAPANPLAYTSPTPVVTFDGNPIPVAFAGLSPGQVGLYQMNIQIPPGTSNGNHTLEVTQMSGSATSNSTLVPVHN